MQKSELKIPDDFKAKLQKSELLEVFEKLPPSHQQEHIKAIEDAKKPETREHRILKALEMLKNSV